MKLVRSPLMLSNPFMINHSTLIYFNSTYSSVINHVVFETFPACIDIWILQTPEPLVKAVLPSQACFVKKYFCIHDKNVLKFIMGVLCINNTHSMKYVQYLLYIHWLEYDLPFAWSRQHGDYTHFSIFLKPRVLQTFLKGLYTPTHWALTLFSSCHATNLSSHTVEKQIHNWWHSGLKVGEWQHTHQTDGNRLDQSGGKWQISALMLRSCKAAAYFPPPAQMYV